MNSWLFPGIIILLALIILGETIIIVRNRKNIFHGIKSMVDPITGIGNRDYFTRVFDNVLPEKGRDNYYLAYISFEETKGRKLLTPREMEDVQRYAARRLAAMADSDEYIAQTGEGVFAFIFQCGSEEQAKERIESVLKALKDYLSTFQREYGELFSAGVCSLGGNRAYDGDYALAVAKQGYYYAVRNKLPYAFSTREIVQKCRDDEKIRLSLSKAIENGEFEVYLQFIVTKEDQRICGAEVLSRWENREFGLMMPGRYINIMRTTGDITEHDYSIFKKLCALLESWKNTEYSHLFLTGNFTRISVSEENFAQRIREISQNYDFDHSKLVIEITEDSLTEDSKVAAENLRKCKAMGFRIAIDDMGSGFSSISDMSSGEIDLVKIDRNIVIEGTTEKGRKLLEGIIALAHRMNIKALCEGVETPEQVAMILNTKCDYIQGFAYSHVLRLDEAMKFLKEKNQE